MAVGYTQTQRGSVSGSTVQGVADGGVPRGLLRDRPARTEADLVALPVGLQPAPQPPARAEELGALAFVTLGSQVWMEACA